MPSNLNILKQKINQSKTQLKNLQKQHGAVTKSLEATSVPMDMNFAIAKKEYLDKEISNLNSTLQKQEAEYAKEKSLADWIKASKNTFKEYNKQRQENVAQKTEQKGTEQKQENVEQKTEQKDTEQKQKSTTTNSSTSNNILKSIGGLGSQLLNNIALNNTQSSHPQSSALQSSQQRKYNAAMRTQAYEQSNLRNVNKDAGAEAGKIAAGQAAAVNTQNINNLSSSAGAGAAALQRTVMTPDVMAQEQLKRSALANAEKSKDAAEQYKLAAESDQLTDIYNNSNLSDIEQRNALLEAENAAYKKDAAKKAEEDAKKKAEESKLNANVTNTLAGL